MKKISFSSSGGDVDVCRVAMASSREASHLQKNMFNQEIFGEFIQADLANLGEEDFNPPEIELDDGSRSWKLFGDVEERSAWPEVSFAPSKVRQELVLVFF